MTYFNVKVQFTVEDSKGKIKKQNVNYLVDSQSCMDAIVTGKQIGRAHV